MAIADTLALQVGPRRTVEAAATAHKPGDSFYIPSLDGIRALAVMLVFAAHAGLNDRIPGSFGVTAFFFLSGYLITTLMRMECDRTGRVSLGAFYLRRALRIFPPMYLVLIVASTLTGLGLLEGTLQVDALAAQALHLSNYYIVANGWWDGRAPGTWIYWSLAVEEHFYLVFPLLYLALRRWVGSRYRQVLVFSAICAVVLAWRLVLVLALGAEHDRTYVASDTRIDSIVFGCILAVYGNPVLDATRISARVLKFGLFPLGLVGIVLSFAIPSPVFADTGRYTLQGLSLLPLFIVAIRFPDWGIMRILNWSGLRFIGAVSYSVYLMHPTILFAVHQWTAWSGVLQGIISFALTLMFATLIYRYVERPCARLRRRLSRLRTVPQLRAWEATCTGSCR